MYISNTYNPTSQRYSKHNADRHHHAKYIYNSHTGHERERTVLIQLAAAFGYYHAKTIIMIKRYANQTKIPLLTCHTITPALHPVFFACCTHVARVEGSINPVASPGVAGLPMTILSRLTPAEWISKMEDWLKGLPDWVTRPSQVVYSVPSIEPGGCEM